MKNNENIVNIARIIIIVLALAPIVGLYVHMMKTGIVNGLVFPAAMTSFAFAYVLHVFDKNYGIK